MRLRLSHVVAGLAFPFAGTALPTNDADEVPYHLRGKRSSVVRDGVKRNIFTHEATGATLDFVTNSGVCETTPGVQQYSGYVSVGSKYLSGSLLKAFVLSILYSQPKYMVLVF